MSDDQNKIINPLALAPGRALVLRVCHAGGVSGDKNQFRWPLEVGAEVRAPDWNPDAICGYGLHGWLWGEGSVDGAGASWAFTAEESATAIWLVVEVDVTQIVRLEGKVKYPMGVVRFVGSAKDAAAMIAAHAPAGSKIIAGTATAGARGTATAGDSGTATAGYAGTATAGDSGTATAGEEGAIILMKYVGDGKYKRVLGLVGEGGIEPNVPYILDQHGKIIRKETP